MDLECLVENLKKDLLEANCSYDLQIDEKRHSFFVDLTNHPVVRNSKTNASKIDGVIAFFPVNQGIVFEIIVTPIFVFDESNNHYYVEKVNEINYFEAYMEKYVAAKNCVLAENNALLLPSQNPMSELNTFLRQVFSDDIFDNYLKK